MVVRDATPEDWPAVVALLAELGRPDVRGTDEEEPCRVAFERYLARPEVNALVAEEDGRVVGFVDMEFRMRLSFMEPQAWIPDLIVTEDRRGAGIGAALMARAEALAKERGCWSMSLDSANWRTGSHAFYQRQGWTNAAKSFVKSLGDRPWPPTPRP